MELVSRKSMSGITARYPYKIIPVGHVQENFWYKVDAAYGYMLRRVRIKYPGRQLLPLPASFQWSALTAYSNTWVIPTAAYTKTVNPLVFYTPAPGGNSGAVEPDWPTQAGATIVDGGITWYAVDALRPYPPAFPYPSSVYSNLLAVPDRVKTEFFDNANVAKLRQTAPFEVELFSTPGSEGTILRNAPQPIDSNNYNVNSSANPPYFSSTLNYLYRYGEAIQIRFSNLRQVTGTTAPDGTPVTLTAPVWCPNYIMVFLEGYFVEEKAFQVFKGRGA